MQPARVRGKRRRQGPRSSGRETHERLWREILLRLSIGRKLLLTRCEVARRLHIRAGCRNASPAMKNRASWLPQTTERAPGAREWESPATGAGWRAVRDRGARHFHSLENERALRSEQPRHKLTELLAQAQPAGCAAFLPDVPVKKTLARKPLHEAPRHEPARVIRHNELLELALPAVHQGAKRRKETSPRVARPRNGVPCSTRVDRRGTHQSSDIIRFSGREACSNANEPEGESVRDDVRG